VSKTLSPWAPRVVSPWILRVLWLAVGAVGAQAVTDATDGTGRGWELTVTIGALALWGVTLVAMLVPLPSTLTVTRIVVPAGAVALVWVLAADDTSTSGVIALACAAGAAVVALTAPVGDRFVDGASYGDERRMPLRPPAALMLGPIPLAWAVAVVGTCAGPLLLADERWVLGLLVTAAGLPAAALAARSLYFLTTRVVVFVPNGLVLTDRTVLTDPVLFHRSRIAMVGPALADTAAQDLTGGAPGLALELSASEPTEMALRSGRSGSGRTLSVDAILFAPTSPGELLAEAQRRRIPVG
jgi:hypothetical protein